MKNFTFLDLNPSQKMELLEPFDLVADLSFIQHESLLPFLKAYRVSANNAILTEGEKHHFFCLICKGDVDIIKSDVTDSVKKINSLGPGKVIGEVSFFDQGACSAGIIAKNDVTLLVIDRERFRELCETTTHVALHITLKLLKSLGQRLRQTTGKLVDLL